MADVLQHRIHEFHVAISVFNFNKPFRPILQPLRDPKLQASARKLHVPQPKFKFAPQKKL